MPTINVYAAGVLAGAYGFKGRRGGFDENKTMLLHAVSDADFTVGRLKREAGEAFCNKNLSTATNLADSGSWESDVKKVDCPKCVGILATHFNLKR